MQFGHAVSHTAPKGGGCTPNTTIAAPSTSQAFTHPADCVLAATYPNSTPQEWIYYFRQQDSSNRWGVWVSAGGVSIRLYEVIATVLNIRTNNTVNMSGGERIVTTMNDETITIYIDGSQIASYSSAANFKTETDGQMGGTSPVPTNLKAWPVDCGGQEGIA